MNITAWSCALMGVDGQMVRVEVERRPRGLSSAINLLGLPEVTMREIRMRLRSALEQSLVSLPGDAAFVVQLAPRAVDSGGYAHWDLPVACGLLAAAGEIPRNALENVCIVGELALDGRLRPVRGVLPMLLAAKAAGITRAIVPWFNAGEASAVEGIEVFPASTLSAVIAHLRGEEHLPARAHSPISPKYADGSFLADVLRYLRVLEIAAAGRHHVLLVGAQFMRHHYFARALIGILPPLSSKEVMETAAVHSAAGFAFGGTELGIGVAPFRAPHYTVSAMGILGGDNRIGEVTLAHHGILVLYDLNEFARSTLESLDEPLSTGTVTRGRGYTRITLPARCQIVATMFPCPCRMSQTKLNPCLCSEERIDHYHARVRPFLKRHRFLRVYPRTQIRDNPDLDVSIEAVRARVLAARERGMVRDDAASERSHLDRVARTIADLDGLPEVTPACLAEAREYCEHKEISS